MRFDLVDRVVEVSSNRAATVKLVTSGEEYLQDHFPGFPVLPGVLMLEAMVQAARLVAEHDGARAPMVLGEVRALKYNRFVPPGSAMRVTVESLERDANQGPDLKFKGRTELEGPDGAPQVAATGRFTLRPIQTEPAVGAGGPSA